MQTRKITLTIPATLYNALEKEAEADDTSLHNLAVALLDRYFADTAVEISDSAATKLWQSVITQAFIDACSPLQKGEIGKKEDFTRARTRRWLLDNGPDFQEACRMAGFEPDYIRAGARKCQARGWTKARTAAAEMALAA